MNYAKRIKLAREPNLEAWYHVIIKKAWAVLARAMPGLGSFPKNGA